MRPSKPVKIEVIRGNADPEDIAKAEKLGRNVRAAITGEILEAYPDPHRTKYYKVYRKFSSGNRDPRPILIPKKDCRIVE